VRPLGTRAETLPGLASAHQQRGLLGLKLVGLVFARGTSAAPVQKLNSATVATLDTLVVQVRIQEIGADLFAPDCRSPNYLQKFADSDTTGVSMD